MSPRSAEGSQLKRPPGVRRGSRTERAESDSLCTVGSSASLPTVATGSTPASTNHAGRREPARQRMSSFTVTGLISKLEHRDRDFRYMASSDLLAELPEGIVQAGLGWREEALPLHPQAVARPVVRRPRLGSQVPVATRAQGPRPARRGDHGRIGQRRPHRKEDQRDICSIGAQDRRPGDAANDGPVGRAPPRFKLVEASRHRRSRSSSNAWTS